MSTKTIHARLEDDAAEADMKPLFRRTHHALNHLCADPAAPHLECGVRTDDVGTDRFRRHATNGDILASSCAAQVRVRNGRLGP